MYFLKKIGYDFKIVLVKWLFDEIIFGGWEEFVRFRIWISKNIIIIIRVKIIRYVISEIFYFEEFFRIYVYIGNVI